MKNTIKTSVAVAALSSVVALASAQAASCPQQGAYGGRGYQGWQWRGHAHARPHYRTGQAQGQQTGQTQGQGQGKPSGAQAEQGQGQNGNAGPSAQQTGSTQSGGLSQDQKDRLRDTLASDASARIDNPNFGLNVGASVPRSEPLKPLPSQAVSIDPRLRGDKFAIAQDDIVIVDPRTNRIVALIPETGGAETSGQGASNSGANQGASNNQGTSGQGTSGEAASGQGASP